jgi:hypothetical protein
MAICVQVTPPLIEYAATAVGPDAIAIKYVDAPMVPPAIPRQFVGPDGKLPPDSHDAPSVENAVVDPDPFIATNLPSTSSTACHVADAGNARAVELNDGVGCDVIDVKILDPGTNP